MNKPPPSSAQGAPVQAAILIIGDELLAGEIADANGPFLAEALTAEGCQVRSIQVLPDDDDVIELALGQACAVQNLVVVCGGLGPTSDDRTTEAVARAVGVQTELHAECWERVRAMFAFRGVEPPAGNEKQATIPVGAVLLPNDHGLAPGYLVTFPIPHAEPTDAAHPGALIAVLPGPPRENRPMLRERLLPELRGRFPGAPRFETRLYRVFGLPESGVGERLRDLERRFPKLRVGYQARFPEILVKLRHAARGGDSGADSDGVDQAEAELREALAPHLYTTGEATLAAVVGRAVAAQGKTLVTAESCTAGLVAKLLTDIPGSSQWFERGFVVYTGQAKTELLGVPADLIATHGEVSEPVAEAMLRGALARSPADLGCAITGIAGPDGGSPEKPVGTVCIAWGDRRDQRVRTYHFPFDRDRNRLLAAWTALNRVYRLLGARSEKR